MANSKAKLDRSRPFATISSMAPDAPAYEQDGLLFGSDEVQCGKVEGYEKKKAAETKKERAKALAADKSAADRAADILGDLEDPQADAKRENAAAAAAEEKAADE